MAAIERIADESSDFLPVVLVFVFAAGGCHNDLREHPETDAEPGCIRYCVSYNAVNGDLTDSARTILCADVERVEPFSSGNLTLSLWTVRLRVTDVISKGKADISEGDEIQLFVHSVVKTFLVDVDSIQGKTFQITYLEPFGKRYEGRLEVSQITGTVQP